MKKKLIAYNLTKNLYMVYDDCKCTYYVTIGKLTMVKGKVKETNVLYYGDCFNDVYSYYNGGKK